MKTIIVLILAILFIACESRSGQFARTPVEKVVIIDRSASTTSIHYKVKRISKGVVCYIYVQEAYEQGDTILHKF